MRNAPWFPCLLLLTTLFLGSLGLQAQTSQTDGNWNDPSTWSPAGVPFTSDNVTINTTVTIPSGTALAEVNNLTIGKDGKLIVNGNLKVNADLTMDSNSTEFTMGSEAIVTVVGNFTTKNKIVINSSFASNTKQLI